MRHAFTLIELLIVIGIIAILLAMTIAALNPNKQLADARNAQRHQDIQTILNAVHQYAIENRGHLPSQIPAAGTAQVICMTGAVSCNNAVDLSVLVPSFVVALPYDPSVQTGTGTHYTIVQQTEGRVKVAAPKAEQGKSLSMTR